MNKVFFIILISCFSLTIISCSDEKEESTETATTTTDNTTTNSISAFSFTSTANSALSSDITGTITGTNITATVPYGTDVTALVATLTHDGASVKVGSVIQTSGTTANDFSSAKTYTVTAADSSTQDYTVTITIAAATTLVISRTGTDKFGVTYSSSNLEWQIAEATENDGLSSGLNWVSGTDVIWDNATSYCINLELACKTNWRLPTKTELASLIVMNQTPKIVSTLSATSLSKYEWTLRCGWVSATKCGACPSPTVMWPATIAPASITGISGAFTPDCKSVISYFGNLPEGLK